MGKMDMVDLVDRVDEVDGVDQVKRAVMATDPLRAATIPRTDRYPGGLIHPLSPVA